MEVLGGRGGWREPEEEESDESPGGIASQRGKEIPAVKKLELAGWLAGTRFFWSHHDHGRWSLLKNLLLPVLHS